MTDEEAVVWCAQHEASVEFNYLAHTRLGDGYKPRVTICAEYESLIGQMGLIAIKFQAETFREAVSGAKASFDLAEQHGSGGEE